MSVKQEQIYMDSYNNIKEITDSILSLREVKPGNSGVIVKVPSDTLLAPLGIRRGKKIKVKNIQPLGGPLVVDVAGRKVAVGRDVASEIKVGKLKNV